MENYLVIQDVSLRNGNDTILKGEVFNSSQANNKNISRWLEHGYIKKLDEIKPKKKSDSNDISRTI